MAKGYMIESKIQAKDIEALNGTGTCSTDLDGGTLVSLGAYSKGVVTLTKSASGQGLAMVYNPSEHLTKVGNEVYAGLTVDPREYTNISGRPVDYFIPKVGDKVILSDGNLAANQTVTVGKYLEQESGGFTVKASATTATTSFKVLEVQSIPFPQKGIGNEYANGYLVECVAN